MRSMRMARRGVFAAGAAVALSATAGCTVFSSSRTTRTETVAAPPPTDPMDNLISMTRLHYLRLQAGASLGGAAAKLEPLAKDRLEHLKRLLAEQARTNRSTPAPATQAGQTVAPPASAAAAISSAVDDASVAQVAFTDQIANVSRYRAALFASIAACLATHRTVLAPS
ncbi:hypothetical protein HKD39_00560 [Nakamurella sp. DB0629]|uniref:Uncharacterized protein n=1 Tax=Nakamurella aerolata TaxID=1656892 RepID=A0A849A4H6_9ACTN|nr:hypothetical protein [Nakamurella aerolata]